MNNKALRITFLVFETLLTLTFVAIFILAIRQSSKGIKAIELFSPMVIQALLNLILAFFINIYFRTASTIEAQIMPTLLLAIILENIEIFQLFENTMFIQLVNPRIISTVFSFAAIFQTCLFVGLGLFQQNHSYVFAENFALISGIGSVLMTCVNKSTVNMTALKANTHFNYLLLLLTILALLCFFLNFLKNHNRVNLQKQTFLCMMALGNFLLKSDISFVRFFGIFLYAVGSLFLIVLVKNNNLWT